MQRPRGMAPSAFDAFIRACFYAGVNPESTSEGTKRVVQTIGAAKASAGTHAQDGTVTVNGQTIAYSAAVDISVRGLAVPTIKKFLQELAKQGFVAWYRHTGSFAQNRHVHAVFAGLPMKKMLQAQVVDFLNDRNGLVGHATETFYTAPAAIDAPLAQMFVRANPSQRARVPKEYLA